MNREEQDGTNGRMLIILAGVVFIVSVAALVALEAMERSTTNLMALVGPVVAGLLVGGHVSNLTSQQNRSIQKIEAQTNGVLDARIRTQGKAATLEALTEAGIVPGSVIPPATPGTALLPGESHTVTASDVGASDATLPPGFVDAALAPATNRPEDDN